MNKRQAILVYPQNSGFVKPLLGIENDMNDWKEFLMSKTDKNYQVAVDSLINVTERVREIGQYPKGDIRIGLHGSFPMSEL